MSKKGSARKVGGGTTAGGGKKPRPAAIKAAAMASPSGRAGKSPARGKSTGGPKVAKRGAAALAALAAAAERRIAGRDDIQPPYHDAARERIDEVRPGCGVYAAYGRAKMGPMLIERTMAIVRHAVAGARPTLTLFNAVRLHERGLRQLDALGEVAHIVRLGHHHQMDNAFYAERYPDAVVWVLPGGEASCKPALPAHTAVRALGAESAVPVPGAMTLLEFQSVKYGTAASIAEAVMLVGDDVLISCDAVQNHPDDYDNSGTAFGFQLPMQLLSRYLLGFGGGIQIGPPWLKENVLPKTDKKAILRDFKAVHKLKFNALVPAHGPPLTGPSGAVRRDYKAMVARTFGVEWK